MTHWADTLGVAMGSAWLSGINLYAAVGTLGLLEHFNERLPSVGGIYRRIEEVSNNSHRSGDFRQRDQ